ncbi:MAG: DUF362 domain-containing protein [Candidatus Omnitrophica bacterium]|nr:DUF362 domain-containing protein [Candidatus Omnitrophota bacterium]
MKSDVYLIKTTNGDIKSRSIALLKLLREINPFIDYKKDDFIPVKLTLGDTKCTNHLSPELVKHVVCEIKKLNAKPFLFDTNVIYSGSRTNAVDHLTLAQNKGFAHSRVGAPFIIADGIFGQDGKEYALDSEYVKNIKLPSFIGMTDNLVVLSHITCHILAGYAGAIKNIAMGMSSRATKQVQHSSLKPHIVEEKCTSCGLCIDICPVKAISFSKNNKAFIDKVLCLGCGECLCACKFNSIFINWGEDHDVFAKRIAEVAEFILSKFKNKFFMNFAFDITKECDCISTKNEKIVSADIGILASKDILALEKATIDLINKEKDIFFEATSEGSYKKTLEHAATKGMGSLNYNLIEI